MHNVLLGLQIILAIVLIAVVLVQPGKMDGFTNFSAGATDTFFAKNKSKTRESFLKRVTAVVGVLFAIVTILLNLSQFK
ncbi:MULTISPECIES: preprotein translocase subunit SecG [Clostridium]|uniref:preprotein translocase subunit SecG n=1 Tax=Clostridium TaxID=1485 RepID=UPI00069E792C|nr:MULTISPECIES: preprotein translocase subunit SecG [Clostridium]KOF57332.1 preprotein translocase subunit SecG [Clostridium sp. DMHC 10]MCD2346535.1 preprotein translocase subunit SecG [Clostridium guangxiense]